MNSISKATGAIIATLISASSFAQFKSNGYEFGVNVGTLIYQGDLSESALGYYRGLKPAVAIYGSKSLDKYFSLRAQLLRGNVHADESKIDNPAWRQQRNFSFTTPVTELLATIAWHPVGKTSETNLSRFSPYLFAGAGISLLNIKRDWSRLNTTAFDSKSAVIIGLGADTIHSTPRVIPVIPVGGGLQFALSPAVALNLEGTYRFTTSDYLDGFKYAANPSRKDNYYGVSLGVSFSLGTNRYNCPRAW